MQVLVTLMLLKMVGIKEKTSGDLFMIEIKNTSPQATPRSSTS